MIISTFHDANRLKELKENGVDAIVVGVEHVSIRSIQMYSLEQVKDLKNTCNQLGLQLYINCLRFFMDQDLELLQKTLQFCKENNIGLYYADEGVLYQAKQIGYEHACVYQPETLITNALDVQFYIKQGIESVSLAHELSLDEIISIASYTPQLEVLISGYFSILYSRRPLIQNYFNALHIPNSPKGQFTIIEQTRKDSMPIIEDEYGTHIFSEQPIQSVHEYPRLKEAGIQRFRIDSIFMDDDWTIEQLKNYKQNNRSSGSNHWYHQQTIKNKEGGNGKD